MIARSYSSALLGACWLLGVLVAAALPGCGKDGTGDDIANGHDGSATGGASGVSGAAGRAGAQSAGGVPGTLGAGGAKTGAGGANGGVGGVLTGAGGTGAGGGTSAGGGAGAPTTDADAGTPEPGGPEGDVHVVKRMGDPSFDAVVTNPTATGIAWLNDHFYRMEVFTPFFDNKTSWYGSGWVYSDSAAIYPGATATSHPDWILKDAGGKNVYLDWGCSGGTCPQFAADVSNPDFRNFWINGLKGALAKGYRGAWIDDVNLALRFSDGTKTVTASSPTTHTMMTEDTWSSAVASFMTAIRAAIPGYELLHNSVWYARPTRIADVYVKQQIQAADVINMEGGFASDGGLTGGTAEWSVYAKMNFADGVHALGRWVVVDDFPSNDVEREYALACYLLLTNGKDGLGDASMAPSTWWKGYDVHLGAALGPRTRSADGVFRREFTQGLVLMLEPGAASKTVALAKPYLTVAGAEVTQVSLTAKQGAVLALK